MGSCGRERGEINRDMCVLPIDGTTNYFVRGELQIPVVDSAGGVFAWSVWVSLSGPNMKTTVEHWGDPHRAALPPMLGWLCNSKAAGSGQQCMMTIMYNGAQIVNDRYAVW